MPLLTTECDLHGELNHSRVHITYTRFARVSAQEGHADPDFLPAGRLHLVHGATERIFSGEQIAVVDTAVGELVTVELPAPVNGRMRSASTRHTCPRSTAARGPTRSPR